MLASSGTVVAKKGRFPRRKEEARISGIRSSTLGTSSKGFAADMIEPGSNLR